MSEHRDRRTDSDEVAHAEAAEEREGTFDGRVRKDDRWGGVDVWRDIEPQRPWKMSVAASRTACGSAFIFVLEGSGGGANNSNLG